ncbi:MAG: hypothetical protein ACLPID_11400 [Beijerinckiaceae bacterium]
MAEAVQANAGVIRRPVRFVGSMLAPSSPNATSFGAAIAKLVLLFGLGLTILSPENPAAAQSGRNGILGQGEAVVTGFSGSQIMTPVPQGVDPAAVTYIDPAGPSARVIDLRNAGAPPQAQVLPAPKPFTVTAAQVGQVFAVALDKASPPNIYLAASSAYGLPIILPALNAGDPAQRLAEGAPGAAFMPGLFGPATMHGGPGSVWRVDGANGQVTLFANVILEGVPNSGPALGGLAFDSASNSLFVADRETGMIHRFGLNGAEIGRYDHGKDGRNAAGLPPVAFDPAARLDIASPNFRAQDPSTWAYALPERRIFALAVHGARLYYAVADGLQIWSVSIQPDGPFGSDARIEVQVQPGEIPSEISKIIFDDRGRMELAERGAPTGAFDFQALAQPAASRVLRYRLLQLDVKTAATWQADPDEYAIGFAAELRNTNGGIAIGYGYRPDGSLDTGACGGFLWTTGEQLRNASDAGLADELAKTGPLALNGLQGNAIDAVRPDNVPPLQSYFANYFDDSGNAAFRGHLGDIAILRGCGQSAFAIPTPVTLIPWWPSGPMCRPPALHCPPGQRGGGGVQCCPQGMAPGLNGECEPLRGCNFTCPIGATPVRRPDGSIQCAWLARCPEGGQADLRGGCQHYCPPGETGWPTRKCCPYGEVGLPDGQCCPERDVHDGRCVRECPRGEIRLPDGQCCPREDVHDGKCVGWKECPRGDIRLPDGQCCPRQDVHDGKCEKECPRGDIRLRDGECCPREDVRDGKCEKECSRGDIRLPVGECCPREDVPDGKCEKECPRGDIRLPGGECCPREDVHDGKCEKECSRGDIRLRDGQCCPREDVRDGKCERGCPSGESLGSDNLCHETRRDDRCAPGLARVNGECIDTNRRRECGPGEFREDGRCVSSTPPPRDFHPRPPREFHPRLPRHQDFRRGGGRKEHRR